MAKKVGAQTLVGIIAILILALIGLAYYSDLIPEPPPPPPPNHHPTVTVTTEVVVEKGAPWDDFKIKSVDSYQAGASAKSDLMWWPQTGKVKLTVTYPSGHKITMTKKVKVESWDSTTVTFNWQTKQEGEHRIIAELYNEENVLVDTKTDSYTPVFPPS